MKVLTFSWEYPPNHVGGLGRHVYHLSSALAEAGTDVHVVTPGVREQSSREGHGPRVHHIVAYDVSAPDFISWVLQLNVALFERAVRAVIEDGPVDVVHAHDWLVAFAARAFKHAFKVPLVATIHATEAGRNAGIHNRQQAYISDVEWWLLYEAWKVICCSEHMKNEVRGVFNVPKDKIMVLPNGVDPDEFSSLQRGAGRNAFAGQDQRMVFFIGRLVREKGVHVLLEAAKMLIGQGYTIKLVIAGTGPYEEELKFMAASMGIWSHVYFTGRVSDKVRNNLYRWADAAVCPSLYEPFGIVALEAMAAGSGLVASDTGGLSEVITDGTNGLKVRPGDAGALAAAISRLITDKTLRERIRRGGQETVRQRYLWSGIARATAELYEDVHREYEASPWGKSRLYTSGGDRDAGRYHGWRRRFETPAADLQSAKADGPGGQPAGDGARTEPD